MLRLIQHRKQCPTFYSSRPSNVQNAAITAGIAFYTAPVQAKSDDFLLFTQVKQKVIGSVRLELYMGISISSPTFRLAFVRTVISLATYPSNSARRT